MRKNQGQKKPTESPKLGVGGIMKQYSPATGGVAMLSRECMGIGGDWKDLCGFRRQMGKYIRD